MTRIERAHFITQMLAECKTVIYIKKDAWGETVGVLQNSLESSNLGSFIGGKEILETECWGDETLPHLTVWFGRVECHWEPLCVIIEFCGEKTGLYYDAL